MDYLWRNYNPNTKYELDFSMKNSAPPIEVSCRNPDAVVINPLPRFTGVFHHLLMRQDLWARQTRELQALSNCILHLVAYSDRVSGVSSALIVEDDIESRLLNGHYGKNIKNSFCSLSRDRKRSVLELLRKHENHQGRILYFREAMKSIFPRAGIYYYTPNKVFLLYLPQAENNIDKECVKLLAALFLDVTAKFQIYWYYPFGIIGKENTMHIGNMRLYGTRKDL